ncbi:MAG: oxidoreductase [Microbacterium sp.]|uniref:Benzoate 1,2-dioxygenase electron transfer component n=1 Tax=Microbacterium ginsengisoli TaxID=400772 RepID=A0A0F0LVS5_9MICO|nr:MULTISPECIES: FAD-binding oxidoreductase [Microbacterium]MAL07935.1 oxidoreductase [Microbacterium sp.]MCK9919885.1 FAD-binding oxidoreductase [Microbacteriaceae bacterium K1510]KJL37208.1 Benzoate 1,2-dioxygenase electron transfer component [Microbacterium ginsengisoli]MBN9209700.1 oxidoreductase [Microbacterium ginsengisoli]ODU77723.1 MAG: oxidoreductase [Microbacterium sp. SCN 71-21]
MTSDWLPATITSVRPTASHAVVLTLDVPGWAGSLPGQHLDVRLTAEDGYRAERSYSLADSGSSTTIELAIDEVPDGEVSPYFVRDARPGDTVEVKGPLGGYFVWHDTDPSPVQLIAGGSGVVPLLSMARARAASSSAAPMRLLTSVRSPADALYRDEIAALAARGIDVDWIYTRSAPETWAGRVGRVDAAGLAASTLSPSVRPLVFVCGPTPFVEAVAGMLVDLGHPPLRVRTERFGGA